MALTSFTPPTYNQLLQAYLNDYKAITNFYGYNLSVDPGSELYLRFSTQAGQLSVLYNLANILVNSKLIDTATGTDLDRVANDFGLQRRGATSSLGFIQLFASVAQTLTAGSTLTGPNSLQYQVTTTGVYSPNANVPISSVDLGSQTNLGIGQILSWSTVQSNMQSTCLVSIAVTGGADTEDDSTLRNRIYLTLQSPPQMGNSQQVVQLSGSVDGIIQQAFVYSNFNGAGTQLIALTGYQTSSYIGRDIPHLQLDGYAKPYGVSQLQPGLLAQPSPGYGAYNQYTLATNNPGQNLSSDTSAIYGQLPGPVANPYATVITTVNNVPSDIAVVLTLPYPIGSPNNGFGNGWIDSQPWPQPDGYYVADGYCKVVSVQGNIPGGFGITVKAPSSGIVHTNPPNTSYLTYNNNTPIPGTTHIQWVNRSDEQDSGWLSVTATVLAATDNTNDTWSLLLDTPLIFGTDGYDFYGNIQVAVGDFISPAALNSQSYLNNIMNNYALLGPGQVTGSQGLLTLGAARYPTSNTQFPNVMGVQLERTLVTSNSEVYAASINPANAYNTAFIVPTINAPPSIYIPREIGWYNSDTYNFGK
jgi:hypothetical protein